MLARLSRPLPIPRKRPAARHPRPRRPPHRPSPAPSAPRSSSAPPTAPGTRVFTTNADGERVPLLAEKNKFLNAQNLAQLAKDTSFIAVMAVGMAVVIIAGGIDLTVGSIYALASVIGALVLNRYGPEGLGATTSPVLGVFLGAGACLGVACPLRPRHRRPHRRPPRASVHHHPRRHGDLRAASPSSSPRANRSAPSPPPFATSSASRSATASASSRSPR